MNITKTVTLKGKRELKLPLENYLAHQEVVEHWIGGGEVEIFIPEDWFVCHDIPLFEVGDKYRIKQREPKPGEVWLVGGVDNNASVVIQNREGGIDMLDLYNYCLWNINAELQATYAAPSVQAWVAREILNVYDESKCFDPVALLRKWAAETKG